MSHNAAPMCLHSSAKPHTTCPAHGTMRGARHTDALGPAGPKSSAHGAVSQPQQRHPWQETRQDRIEDETPKAATGAQHRTSTPRQSTGSGMHRKRSVQAAKRSAPWRSAAPAHLLCEGAAAVALGQCLTCALLDLDVPLHLVARPVTCAC